MLAKRCRARRDDGAAPATVRSWWTRPARWSSSLPSGHSPDPLRVAVRRAADSCACRRRRGAVGGGRGPGPHPSVSSARTDSAGSKPTVPTGSERGRYRARSRIGVRLRAVGRGRAGGGPGAHDRAPRDTLRIVGATSVPSAQHSPVQIADVRAKIVTREHDRACGGGATLPSRVSARCVVLPGSQQSDARSLNVAPGAAAESFPVGRALTLDGADVGAGARRRLPAGSYLMVPLWRRGLGEWSARERRAAHASRSRN